MGHKSQFENWLSGAVHLISWIMNVRTTLPGKKGHGGSGDKCLSDDKYCKMRNLIFQVILKVGKIKKVEPCLSISSCSFHEHTLANQFWSGGVKILGRYQPFYNIMRVTDPSH